MSIFQRLSRLDDRVGLLCSRRGLGRAAGTTSPPSPARWAGPSRTKSASSWWSCTTRLQVWRPGWSSWGGNSCAATHPAYNWTRAARSRFPPWASTRSTGRGGVRVRGLAPHDDGHRRARHPRARQRPHPPAGTAAAGRRCRRPPLAGTSTDLLSKRRPSAGVPGRPVPGRGARTRARISRGSGDARPTGDGFAPETTGREASPN